MKRPRTWLAAALIAAGVWGAPSAAPQAAGAIGVDHIHLAVPDPIQAAAWYVEHFGGRSAEFPGRLAFEPWVQALPLPVQLVFNKASGAPPSDGGVIERLGFSVPDLTRKIAELNAAGVHTELIDKERGPWQRAIAHDPWGVTLEIVQDPKLPGLHHVQLRVPDPVRTAEWYQQVFGGTRLTAHGDPAVRYPKLYVVAAKGDAAPSKGRAFDHISWGPTDIEATVSAARAHGGAVTSAISGPNGLGHHMAFVEDPDHVSIELIQHDELLNRPPSDGPTIDIQNYTAMPITGKVDGKELWDRLLARVNGIREEPAGVPGAPERLFINDLNGPLYILEKATGRLSVYLDFNGRDDRPGIFHKLIYETGSGNGLSSFQFDPDYAHNGKFYTVHIENPALPGSNLPDNAHFPGLNVEGYAATRAVTTPGPVLHEAVLIEWTDTNPRNATFEGSARELLRVQLNTRIHPMGEVNFNPSAKRGDPDWRVLYIGCGDGGSGEAHSSIRSNPQRLDTLVGKILRIVPDLHEHVGTSAVSENGRYRIPHDNPFVGLAGARGEIWAYGLRNPYRLNWGVDAAHPENNRLLSTTVGLSTWEMVYVIRRGANYGYSLREGNELLKPDNTTAPLPSDDRIPIQIGESPTSELIAPTYPVAQYGHVAGGGDAIGSGYLYTGRAIPALRGKFLFTDLTTGRVWYADYAQMLAADDGKAATLAPLHEVKIRWSGAIYDTLKPITEKGYHTRGGLDPNLPGVGKVSGQGRADTRFAVDGAGELYLIGKSDAMIRKVVSASGF